MAAWSGCSARSPEPALLQHGVMSSNVAVANPSNMTFSAHLGAAGNLRAGRVQLKREDRTRTGKELISDVV
jgi:hypothetical protein